MVTMGQNFETAENARAWRNGYSWIPMNQDDTRCSVLGIMKHSVMKKG